MAESRGDTLAQRDGFKEPQGVDFSYQTWQNYPVSDETMDEKSKAGGDAEGASRPLVTITTETTGTSGDSFEFEGSVSDINSDVESLTYEITGGFSRSGVMGKRKFTSRRIKPPYGGNWNIPVSPIAVGLTTLNIRGLNLKGRYGPWATKTITRTPTAGPVVPCECTVFTDPFLVINPADWTLTDGSGIAEAGPDGWEHFDHAADFARLLGQGNFAIGGDFDICVEVDITNFTATPGGTTYFMFAASEGVKGGAEAYLHLQVSSGNLVYFLAGNGNWSVVPTYPAAVGTHYLRLTRIGTTVTAWVWNPITEQFEWDGNPAGHTNDQVWDVDPYVYIQWRDTSVADYIEGSCKAFCINAGTKI